MLDLYSTLRSKWVVYDKFVTTVTAEVLGKNSETEINSKSS